jgi:flagellar biosynthetic protein FlhB
MAEEQDTERELPASQKRLDEAREKGQTPRSRELTTAVLLLAGAATLAATGPRMAQEAGFFMRSGLTIPRSAAFDPAIALEAAGRLAWQGFMPALPILSVLFVAALVAPLAIGGWLFTTEPLMPDFGRLNPLRGLSNMISMKGLAELGKALAKVLLIGGVVGSLIWRGQEAFLLPLGQAPADAAAFAGGLITRDFLWMSTVLIAIAAFDVPLQLWTHARELRMSKDELKREAKESEGDPQIKGKIRARQREAARRRMMAAVPKADVIVTNPTHYAVAISYKGDSMRAPRVVAKGTDEVAARIRALGDEHGVPILEAPPLARALYAHAELEADIPAALYNAVAQVLAWVFQLRALRSGPPPARPDAIPVPAGLDPAEAGGAALAGGAA